MTMTWSLQDPHKGVTDRKRDHLNSQEIKKGVRHKVYGDVLLHWSCEKRESELGP